MGKNTKAWATGWGANLLSMMKLRPPIPAPRTPRETDWRHASTEEPGEPEERQGKWCQSPEKNWSCIDRKKKTDQRWLTRRRYCRWRELERDPGRVWGRRGCRTADKTRNLLRRKSVRKWQWMVILMKRQTFEDGDGFGRMVDSQAKWVDGGHRCSNS